MTTYNNTFGNDTVPPSQYGYQALSISANTTLEWPYNSTGGTTTSKLIDLTATAGSLSLTLPDATQVSTGEDILIRNVGAQSVTVKDNGGGTIGTVSAGAASYFYLTSNATAAGAWGLIAYGVGTSNVDAATLVGYGLIASGPTLNQASPVTTDAGATVTVNTTYRAKTLVLTGGAATVALPAVATAGDNFFLFLRNGGTGTVTINPDGSELIDGASTLGIQPGESLMLVCSGAAWYSVGYGRAVLYQFSQLVKDVSAAGSFTLSASEASNKLLTFTGNPASAVTIIVPNTVAVYYTQSSISTAQTITIKTAAGTGSGITQSQRVIVICDGTNVVAAQSAAATSAVSYPSGNAAAPSINFSASTNTGLFLKGANGVGISANGTEAMAVETTGTTLAAPLVVASGGTGRTTGTTAYGLIAAGTTATGAQQTLAAGATTEILVGGGAAALPVWTAATGSGAPVRANSPTLVTPSLGTPASITLTNATGLPVATGITGLGTGVATALAVNVDSAGAPVLFNGAGGTPSSMVGTNITGTAAGLTAGTASAVAVGGITGLGTSVATALAVAVGTDGAFVVKGGALGTPSSGNLANCTGIPVSAGSQVQAIEATPYTTWTSITTTIPIDDTIPQNTEGDQFVTATITPTSATNRLRIDAICEMVNAGSNLDCSMALFQDSTANALAAATKQLGGSGVYSQIIIAHEMAAGTTSATTFKIRIGPGSGTIYVNGNASNRIFGGVSAIRLRVVEIKV